MVVADFNGDGTMDMVANAPSLGGFPGVFLADANGAFHEKTMLQVSHHGIMFVVRDWNSDGFPDLVNTAQLLSVYLNQGNGTFADEMECGVFTSSWDHVVVEDFNHDGHFDVAAGMIDNGVGVLMGMGGCQFQPMVEYPLSDRLVNLAYGDVDGDGLGDLVARTGVGDVYLLHGNAGETFEVSLLSSVGVCANDCSPSLGEVTGDGRVDVVVPGGAELWGDGGGTRRTVNPTQILGNACP